MWVISILFQLVLQLQHVSLGMYPFTDAKVSLGWVPRNGSSVLKWKYIWNFLDIANFSSIEFVSF